MNGSDEAPRFEIHVTAESHFSWIRTRLSLERTLMSWIRTAVSLIGFGFTIFQFFERLNSMQAVSVSIRPEAPRYIGLALIAAGILALAISLWQYRWGIRYLWSQPYQAIAGAKTHEMQTPTVALAIFLMVVGFAAFLAILFRIS